MATRLSVVVQEFRSQIELTRIFILHMNSYGLHVLVEAWSQAGYGRDNPTVVIVWYYRI